MSVDPLAKTESLVVGFDPRDASLRVHGNVGYGARNREDALQDARKAAEDAQSDGLPLRFRRAERARPLARMQWSVCFGPVMAKVSVREVLRPAVESPGQRCCLSAPGGEVAFQDNCEDYIT